MIIDGTAAVVSGGASGLGAATARLLAGAGARVAIFDIDEAQGESAAAELGASFHRVDIRKEEEVEAGLVAAARAHGTARILVNCAGIAPAMKIVGRDGEPHAIDRYRHVIEVNLIGTFLLMSRFAARLARETPVEDDNGAIVNTASIAAFDGQIGHAAYAASKSGIVGMTLPVARELARSQIRVMTIAPGIFHTPILGGTEQMGQSVDRQPLLQPTRFGEPSEFAELVRAILINPMLNGETIRIDGAVRLAPR